jgi:Ca-activated chloride channel family protein
MKGRSPIRKVAIAGAISLFALVVFIGAPEKARPDYTIRTETRLVLLDVSVKNADGGFASGLSIDNFQVLENGRPQKISVFDNHDVPVTVGILVDESYSMTPKRADVLAAAQIFIEESNPHDEVFVLNFNDAVTHGLPPGVLFSDNPEQLRAALYSGVPGGKTALNDAIVAGLEQLKLGRQEKKTLVAISDGGDNASTHKRREMLDMAERSLATIYTVGLFDPEDQDRDPRILERLAKLSGGAAYLPQSLKEMVPVCRNIAKDIRTRYTIGYVPPAQNGPEPRHIQVRVSSPDHARLIARCRSSYRYDETGDTKADSEQ